MKKILIGLNIVLFIIIVSLVIGLLFVKKPVVEIKDEIAMNDYKNTAYLINGQQVVLKNGISETETAPGSASKVITRYFGNEVKYDFNSDGREDVAFILTQTTGGSGTFYYVVASLNTVSGYVGSSGFLLGDRIAPQTTEMGKGNVIVVNYADRRLGESFAVQPSVGKSVWLLLDTKTMQFGEVAQNFEGEADPARMTLGMKTWNWISTTYSDGKSVKPKAENKFTLTLKSDKTFSATTDCNSVGGEYTVTGNKLVFSRMLSTMMFCEGSQEQDFVKMLGGIDSFMFTSKGELVLELKMDSGSVVFK